MEATQVSIDTPVDKQNVVYSYKGRMLFSFKKGGNQNFLMQQTTFPHFHMQQDGCTLKTLCYAYFMLISHSQNNEYCIFHLYEVRAVTKLMKIESRMVTARARR